MSPAQAQFRDGPAVPYGPFVDERAYAAWAEQHQADLVYGNRDEIDLDVYRYEEEGLIWLIQGGDQIAVPVEDFGQFLHALERFYADAKEAP